MSLCPFVGQSEGNQLSHNRGRHNQLPWHSLPEQRLDGRNRSCDTGRAERFIFLS